MFCGWGQQRYDYRSDHDGTENGHFLNVGAYATEDKYRSYIAHMDEHGIHPGTIIIDYKWAKQDALAAPDPLKWTDMRAFIAEQVRLMIGDAPDCLNADGFKIDFTQNIASERRTYRNYLSTSLALLSEDHPAHVYSRLVGRRIAARLYSGRIFGHEGRQAGRRAVRA